MPVTGSPSLTIRHLANGYRKGEFTPAQIAEECLRRIEKYADPATWISLFSADEILAQARKAEHRLALGEKSALLGVPFAIKDNIDMAGHPTTAGCPDFSYRPHRSAAVVEQLLEAGAIAVGKTNLDQFATGLVGVRSAYGTPRNPFNSDYIPGGSSSGSAVAVSAGMVSFSLGTDTAGSGRMPAAFNNIVGFKPTCGLFSTLGIVPACRSLDCVSVFSLTCADAADVMQTLAQFDPRDPYSRGDGQIPARPHKFPAAFRFGIPAQDRLNSFGDTSAHRLYHASIDRMKSLGGTAVEIDYAPFQAAGELLYDGPWIAERLAGLRQFIADKYDSLLPLTRQIIQGGRRFDAVAAFDGFHELRTLQRLSAAQWQNVDLLLVPTAATAYTRAQVEADPIRINHNLGLYTTFVNLLDLSAVAVPAGFLGNQMPWGVSLIAPAGNDAALLALGDRFHHAAKLTLGATSGSVESEPGYIPAASRYIRLAVVGVHLTGQPLNHQLTSLDARLVVATRTAPTYRLYALANTTPPKPGLVRTIDATGTAIEVEVWEMTPEAFGKLVAAVPQPMAIGNIRLEGGEEVKGFLCEPCAIVGGRDISEFGGWVKYVCSLATAKATG